MTTPKPTLTPDEFRRIQRVIDRALKSVDRITLGRQRRVAIERKLDGSEVTAADRAAERNLRQALGKHWPGECERAAI